MSGAHASVVRARLIASRVIGYIVVIAASCLVAAAVLIALKANPSNNLVSLIKHLAQFFDLGFFSLANPIKEIKGAHGEALTALLNYGVGAVVWLLVGKFVARLVRG